ncbi:MAG: hypothetical protein ACXU9G_01215, partial [Syntrophales bacterium]
MTNITAPRKRKKKNKVFLFLGNDKRRETIIAKIAPLVCVASVAMAVAHKQMVRIIFRYKISSFVSWYSDSNKPNKVDIP